MDIDVYLRKYIPLDENDLSFYVESIKKYDDFLQSYPKLKHTLLIGIAGKHSAADDKLVLSMSRRDIPKM